MRPLSLIICATQRSGSYYLLDLLSQSGLPYGDEWLTPYHIHSRKRTYGAVESLPYIDYLKLLSERERHDDRIVVKAMSPQFKSLVNQVKESADLEGESFLQKFASIFPNPRFIYLERRDKVAQAISHLRARQTGRWVSLKGNAEKDSIQPNYSFLGILNEHLERARMERDWNEMFLSNNLDVYRLCFESVRKDPQESINKVFEWLGMGTPEKMLESREERFKPMATDLNSEWRGRFDEDIERSRENVIHDRKADVSALALSETDLKECYQIGENNTFEVKFVSAAGRRIDPVGRKNGEQWLRVTGILQGNGEKEWFQQELRPDSDGCLSALCLLPKPAASGSYKLKLMLSDCILMPEAIEQLGTVDFNLRFEHPPQRAAFRQLIPGIKDLTTGWQHLDWFGYFMDDKFPWIYHAEHEWLFWGKDNESGGPFSVLDANLGWIRIDPHIYPVITSLDKGEKWEFLRRSDGIRTFRRLSDGSTFQAETNRPEHLKNL